MIKRVTIIVLAIIALSVVKVDAQSCSGFHKTRFCTPPDIVGFRIFGQSRSRLVEAKKTFRYKVVLFGGYDYKIGICTERGYGPVQFKIIDAADNTVFYDNSNDEYIESVGFAVEKTKNAIFEVTVLAAKKEFKDALDARACCGIAIYWRKIPKTGF